MALAEGFAVGGSWLGAAITFVLYGLVPGAVALYLVGTPSRRAARRRAAASVTADPDCGGHPDGAAVGGGEQHRQAIGGLDDAGDADLARHGGIGFGDRRAGRRIGGTDADDAGAVDLAQEDRRRARRLGEQRSIGCDAAAVVAD